MRERNTARVPVLTWHSMDVSGPGYEANQHVAFRDDLERLHRAGVARGACGATSRARWSRVGSTSSSGCVGLTFDDGSDFDFHDLPHPAWGPQRGIAGILEDFRARHGAAAQPRLHATSFAIVSPAARAELDRTCMIGCRWWNDDWWRVAEARGLLAVESHGWDHNHESLARTVASAPRGAFDLRTHDDARAEIAQASVLLRRLRSREGDVLFAYPYGEASHVPGRRISAAGRSRSHGVYAAFTTDPAPVTAACSRWRHPPLRLGMRTGNRSMGSSGCSEMPGACRRAVRCRPPMHRRRRVRARGAKACVPGR